MLTYSVNMEHMKNAIDSIQHVNTENFKKYGIRLTSKTTQFQWDCQVLNAWAYWILNVHQFSKPKSSYFLRETEFIFAV